MQIIIYQQIHLTQISEKQMKHKNPKYVDSEVYPFVQIEKSINSPVKSPSPDKKRSNIITPTKSPQLIQIKRNITPSRVSQRKFEKTPIDTKPFEQSTRYYTNEDFQQYRSSQKKNEVLEQLENLMPEEFALGNSHLQYFSQPHSNSKELDYIKLLQEKQRTIKELHEIIEMINKNNSLDLSASQVSGTKNRRLFQSSNKTVFSIRSNEEKSEKQLKNQIRILTIQNQQLIHMIDRFNQEKKEIGQIQESFKKEKQQYTTSRMKEEMLSREIEEMKDSLQRKDQDFEDLLKENKELYNKYLQSDQQNQKLIKMMKDKELSDRKFNASLIQSNISQKSSISESQTKEKLTLLKIKEQYNQSLKVFKDTVCQDVEDFMREVEANTRGLENRLREMEDQVSALQKFKSAYERTKQQQPQSLKQLAKKSDIEQLSDIEMNSPEKQKTREIQSLLMQKNDQYERQLQTQRQTNKQMNYQLQQLRKQNQQLQRKYQQLLEENAEMNEKLRMQISESPKRNMEEIEDINIAKAQEAEIQKLRELVKNYEEQFEAQKQGFVAEIQNLKDKARQYEKIIESQRQQFEQKQVHVQRKISEKELELVRNSSKYQSQIDHLKELIEEKQLSVVSSKQNLESEIDSLRNSIIEKEATIKEKSQEIEELRQKERKMEENEEYMKEQISKLVQNYEKEINILKLTLANDQLRHENKILELNCEIRKLISHSENTEELLIHSQSNHNLEVTQLKEKMQLLQNELSSKNRESRELLHSKEALEVQHSQMKQTLDQLYEVTKQVENLQEENKDLKESLQRSQTKLTEKDQTIQDLQTTIRQQWQTNKAAEQRIQNLQSEKEENKQTINQLQAELKEFQSRLGLVRRQSEELINQKNMDFAVEVEKYQDERVEYEFIINQLKKQLSNLNLQIDLLREQSLTYRDGYNQLLYIKQSDLLNQLYQLRSLVAKSLATGLGSQGDKQFNYDLGKLYIEYQAKIQQNKILQSSLDELKEENKKAHLEKSFLEEKISFLEKDISLSQNQLKQRKMFCEKLIAEKNKLESELLLIKKLKLEAKQEESEYLRQSLLQRVNNLVKLEEKREADVKKVLEKRSESPIRQIDPLISRVEQFETFHPRKVQDQQK